MDPELEAEAIGQSLNIPNLGGIMPPVGANPVTGLPMPQRSGPPMGAPMAPNMPQRQGIPPQLLNMASIPYEVRKGDTIAAIARKNNTTVEAVKKFNPEIKNINRIFPGQEIRIPMSGGFSDFMSPEEGPSLLAQKIQSGLGQPAPTALGALTGDINFDNPANQRSIQPSFDAMQNFAGAVGAGMAPSAGMGALGGLARMMPRPLPPAGRVAMPMSKGAVDWPGAAKTFSNVRPLNIPVGAERAMGVSARRALEQARENPTLAQLRAMLGM